MSARHNLERISSQGITKAQYDKWTENMKRPYTDPWISLHHHSRPKYTPSVEPGLKPGQEKLERRMGARG